MIGRIALVAVRELRAERRQPDGVVAAVTFIAVLVLLESLVVGPQIARDADVASALFWLALAFATILATMRSFDRELEDDALEGLVSLPGGRDALFGGKVLSLAIVLLLVALVGGILSLVLLDLPVALPLHLLVVVLLGVLAIPPVVVDWPTYLRDNLRTQAKKWQTHAAARPNWDDTTASGALSTAAHTAYHLGALRQILAAQT